MTTAATTTSALKNAFKTWLKRDKSAEVCDNTLYLAQHLERAADKTEEAGMNLKVRVMERWGELPCDRVDEFFPKDLKTPKHEDFERGLHCDENYVLYKGSYYQLRYVPFNSVDLADGFLAIYLNQALK